MWQTGLWERWHLIELQLRGGGKSGLSERHRRNARNSMELWGMLVDSMASCTVFWSSSARVVLTAVPKKVPFVTGRRLIQPASTKTTLGTVAKTDRLLKRHILQTARKGRPAGRSTASRLPLQTPRTIQIPRAAPRSRHPGRATLCPKVELHSAFCTSSGFSFLQCHIFQTPLPLITPYSQHHIQKVFQVFILDFALCLFLALPPSNIWRVSLGSAGPASSASLGCLRCFRVSSPFHLISSQCYAQQLANKHRK